VDFLVKYEVFRVVTVNNFILWGVKSCIVIKVSKDLAACFFRVEQLNVQERRNIFANIKVLFIHQLMH